MSDSPQMTAAEAREYLKVTDRKWRQIVNKKLIPKTTFLDSYAKEDVEAFRQACIAASDKIAFLEFKDESIEEEGRQVDCLGEGIEGREGKAPVLRKDGGRGPRSSKRLSAAVAYPPI